MRATCLAAVAIFVLPLPAQTVTYQLSSSWGSGFQGAVTVTNGSAAAWNGWVLEFDLPYPITSLWDGVHTDLGGGRHRVTNTGWNGQIAPNGSASFGFVGSGAGSVPMSGACLQSQPAPVNGVPSNSNCPPPPPPPSAGPPPAPVPENRSGKKIVGYFAAWGVYARNYHVADVPADRVTHLNYAFANLNPAGQVLLGDPWADVQRVYPGDDMSPGALHGSFNQLLLLKKRKPHLKTLISIGGWTWSAHFSTVASTAQGRATFAQSAADFMATYGFDGVDIDWEYPVSGGLAGNSASAADPQNFTLLLQETRARLDAREIQDGREYLLTIAGPAGPQNIPNLQLGAIHPLLDWINVMTYDFHGSWSSVTNFNAPLRAVPGDPNPPSIAAGFNSQAAILGYLAAGVPAAKLHLGLPFYGRGFANVGPANNGLFQPFQGLPSGTWEPGVFDYEDLALHYVPTWTRHYHALAESPWLHSPQSGVMISYDDPVSIAAKTSFALAQGLGGLMFWEFSGDDAQASLLNTIAGLALVPSPWLQLSTSGGGLGDLRLYLYGAPPAASHLLVAASATPAPLGPGTGPVFGLVPDALFLSFLQVPAAPQSPLHFPVSASPYLAGSLVWPQGTFAGLAGQHWACVAAAYTAPSTLLGVSGIAPLDW